MRYPSVGRCIYCGSTEGLTDEHIIPEGLHGPWVLPKSSCETCSVETGRFEQRVLRGPLWPPKTELGLKTKRPRERPQGFPLTVVRNGKRVRENVPVGSNLPSVILPLFGKPGFLTPSTPLNSIEITGWYVGHISRTPEQVKQELGAEGVWIETNYPVIDFARMLAKIAYSYAVAQRGLDHVIAPLVLPGILGKGNDLGQWVGCASDAKPHPDPEALHGLQMHTKGDYIAVAIQLFTFQPTPIYTVFVSRGHRA